MLTWRFEWDEAKNRRNIRKHGLDFADVAEVFRGPVKARPDTREDYGEERWIALGLLKDRVVAIAFAQAGDDFIRVISFRKADRDEREEFEEALQDRLGQD